MIKQPKDYVHRSVGDYHGHTGHWLLLAMCLGVVVFVCAWALGEALLEAMRNMP